jgi:hypothetical protein
VHTDIVLQHIEVERGLALITRLIEKVRPGGVAMIHVTFGKSYVPNHYGAPLPPPVAPPKSRLSYLGDVARWIIRPIYGSRHEIDDTIPEQKDELPIAQDAGKSLDPPMHMHRYDLSKVAFILQQSGFEGFHARFSDHGGELGVQLYARRR